MKTWQYLTKSTLITVQVERVSQLSEARGIDLINIFNRFGCVILACPPLSNLRENLLELKTYFGRVVPHRSSDIDGVATITPSTGANYTALTGQPFAFHTDGSFMPVPPKVVALQCEIPSETGGVSQLVQAQTLYRFLHKQDPSSLKVLFEPDAVVSTTSDGEVYTGPVLTRFADRVMMSYRPSDHQVTVQTKTGAVQAYELIQTYLQSGVDQFQYKLQSGEILVMDNTRILHTRTSFDENQGAKRKLYRLWMDGQPTHDRLEFGFKCLDSLK